MSSPIISKIVLLPDGQRINLDNLTNWSLSSYTITFTRQDSSTFTYVDPNGNAQNAASIILQLDQIAFSGTDGPGMISWSSLTITSISPVAFDITTATLTVKGTGFDAATIGKLYFEDNTGGQDSNGYFAICTFVDSSTLTAAYGGPGDATAPNFIYYQDSNGQTSNNIGCTVVSGTQITIP